MHEVYTFACEAGSDLYVLLFHVEDEREEALDLRWRNIVSVGTLDKRLQRKESGARGESDLSSELPMWQVETEGWA